MKASIPAFLFVISLLFPGNNALAEVPVYVAQYKDDKACAISYTFDDNLKEHYTLLLPRLEEHGFKATFWINGSRVNDNDNIVDTTRMTWAELREMADLGHEVSNHGWAHKNFGRHSMDEIREDVLRNDSAILANIGRLPRTFCYPNNTKTPEGVAFVSQDRVGTRLFQRSIGNKATASNLEAWTRQLIDSNKWGVGMTHGITYGYDSFRNPQVLWNHFESVKANDSIWVATFEDVAAYIQERDSVSLTILQNNKDEIIVQPELSLDKNLFDKPLTLVIKTPNLRQIQAVQGGEPLRTQLLPDKALVEFNPHGGRINILIRDYYP